MKTETTTIMGLTTTYVGKEIADLRGMEVRILAVLRGGTDAHVDVDSPDYLVGDDGHLARLGGVTKADRVAVRRLRDGRETLAHFAPRAVDLECFADLRGPARP